MQIFNNKIDLLCLVVLFFATALPIYSQANGLTPSQKLDEGSITIDELKFSGDFSFKEKTLRNLFPFVEGDVIDKNDVQEAFKELFATGFFKNLVFDLNEVNEKFILTVIAEENVRLGAVRFVGNYRFSDFLLKKEIDLNGKYFDKSKIPLAKISLEEKYKNDGFINVAVSSKVEDISQGKKEIVFFVEEGLQYIVKNITFNGNTNISSRKLKGALTQKKKTLIEKGFLDEFKVSESEEKLKFIYKTKGYVRAKIASKKLDVSFKNPKKKRTALVTINFEIEEGEQYKFGNYEIVGNKVFSKATLIKDFKRKQGRVYNENVHLGDTATLYGRFQENGYVFARVTPIEEIDDEKLVVNHRFEVYEGDKGHIEKIFVEGLKKTKKNVVRREIVIREGEIFSSESLQRTLVNLNRLDFFQSVIPDFRPGSEEGLLNLLLKVKEKQTAVISGGFTYSTAGGFIVNAQLRDSNFLGRGFSFGGKVSIGLLVKSFQINFTEPWFLNKSISLGASFSISKIYSDFSIDANLLETGGNINEVTMPGGGEPDVVNTEKDSIKYTTDNISFSVFSGQRFGTFYEFSELIGVDINREYLQKEPIWPEKYSQYDIYEENKHLFSTPPPIDESSISYFFQIGFSRDSLDNRLNPTTGNLLQLTSTFYFGSKNASKWSIDYSTYFSPVRIPVPALNSAFTVTFFYQFVVSSFANPIVGDFSYPDRSLFAYLRPLEMRGWEYANVYNFRSERFGDKGLIGSRPYGRAKMQHTFEMRTSLPVDFLQFVLFFDAGNLAVNKINFDPQSLSFLFDAKNMLYDAGFGFRLNLPQLPIRLYWSWRFIYDHPTSTLRLFEHALDKKTSTYPPVFVLDFQAGL